MPGKLLNEQHLVLILKRRVPLRRGGRRPAHAGPWPNPRQGGGAPRERRPGLIGARTAAGRAELGHVAARILKN